MLICVAFVAKFEVFEPIFQINFETAFKFEKLFRNYAKLYITTTTLPVCSLETFGKQ